MPIIAIGGPPHSGKSVFISALYRQLLKHSNRVFLQRACPDAFTIWSSEADPEIVRSIRKKGQFSAEFIPLLSLCLNKIYNGDFSPTASFKCKSWQHRKTVF